MEDRPEMREPRSKQVVINIEESVAEMFQSLAAKNRVSTSTLGRKLIIKHLLDQGLMTEEGTLERLLG